MVIERLDVPAAAYAMPQLVALLQDVVEGGAAVGFLLPLGAAEAESYWRGVVAAVERGTRILLVAREADSVIGTVQLDLAQQPNGAHRAEVLKLLVHRTARRRGVGRALLHAADDAARHAGRSLLVLDTRRGDAAERLYLTHGYTVAGVIPDYARSSDGSMHDTVIFYRFLDR